MNVPEQCGKCRHAAYEGDGALCRVREMQYCDRQGDMQTLRMIPGHCGLINQNNDCDRFAPPRFGWLRKIF